jgi:Ni2+-binding GTPase involved in maturation of urease and hydrogenase
MIGGFLGAGKTTSVAQLARRLSAQGLRVGLITNDQGSHLVDTAMLASQGFPVEEIAGGCFCCRFNSLMEAASRLTEKTRPNVFIAEPVGSCTDLVATVTYPLRRIYGDDFTVAPLSVLLDAVRALRVLGLADGAKFSDKVLYIYRKQLEEADLLVINKCDLVQPAQLESLRAALSREFPRAELFDVAARTSYGLEAWFDRVTRLDQPTRPTMQVDYDTYAEGEALLGWLNATVLVTGADPFDGNEVLTDLALDVQRRLKAVGAEVAHFKMTLDPDNEFGDLGVVNLVRNDYVPELSQSLPDPLQSGELILNLRAEAAPETLRDVIEAVVRQFGQAKPGLALELQHLEQFRPGRPVPVHRVTSGE